MMQWWVVSWCVVGFVVCCHGQSEEDDYCTVASDQLMCFKTTLDDTEEVSWIAFIFVVVVFSKTLNKTFFAKSFISSARCDEQTNIGWSFSNNYR